MMSASVRFTETVEQFCAWAEGDTHPLVEGRQFLITLISALPDLAALRDTGTSSQEFPRRGHAGWQEDHQRFSDLPFQYYRKVFDPHDFGSDEPVTGDLLDDFADIYGDLWHGLQAVRTGETPEALSLWVDSYFVHWGHHANSALNAIDAFYRHDQNRDDE